MKTPNRIIIFACFALAFCMSRSANAQISISVGKDGKSTASFGGVIAIKGDVTPITTAAFECVPIKAIKGDEKVAAMVSEGESWSVETKEIQGAGKCPAIAIVKTPSGSTKSLYGSTTTFKKDIKAGETVRIDGYIITSARALKSGDSVPTACVDFTTIYSLGSVESAKDKKLEPWLTIIKEDRKPGELASDNEVWKILKEHYYR